MSRRRRSYEAGHKAKYLVIIDDTPECDRAMYYASRRAARVGVSVVMLRVIETRDHGQQWLGVADIMRAEAHEEANARLATFAARSNGIATTPADTAWLDSFYPAFMENSRTGGKTWGVPFQRSTVVMFWNKD